MMMWFDMDGTIANLYAVQGWLENLIAEETRPYETCEPLVNMVRLAECIHNTQTKGNKVGIISWTSKGGSEDFNNRVAIAKKMWLCKYLPTVEWDEINIVPYGTNKKSVCGNGILFDDEEHNRLEWGEGAFLPEMIFNILG